MRLSYFQANGSCLRFRVETGEPLYADYFASWNILADLMPDYLPGEKKPVPLFF